jgi:hypothetical protein
MEPKNSNPGPPTQAEIQGEIEAREVDTALISEPITTLEDTRPPSVADLLQSAIDKGMDPDGLTKLVDLYERMEAKAAAREFAAALRGFQNECPVLHTNKPVKYGDVTYAYTTYDYLKSATRPHMDKWGLSDTYDSEPTQGGITIICILRHTSGHAERTRYFVPLQATAKMDEPKKMKSARSIGMRCALELALGIATGGDDDGTAAGAVYITDDQLNTLDAMVQENQVDRARFLKFLGVDQLGHLPQSSYTMAETFLIQKTKVKP